MLKWIKVRQDSSSSTIAKSNDETDVQPVKEDEDDSGMEREDSPAVDLSLLKKVRYPLTIFFFKYSWFSLLFYSFWYYLKFTTTTTSVSIFLNLEEFHGLWSNSETFEKFAYNIK